MQHDGGVLRRTVPGVLRVAARAGQAGAVPGRVAGAAGRAGGGLRRVLGRPLERLDAAGRLAGRRAAGRAGPPPAHRAVRAAAADCTVGAGLRRGPRHGRCRGLYGKPSGRAVRSLRLCRRGRGAGRARLPLLPGRAVAAGAARCCVLRARGGSGGGSHAVLCVGAGAGRTRRGPSGRGAGRAGTAATAARATAALPLLAGSAGPRGGTVPRPGKVKSTTNTTILNCYFFSPTRL